MAGALVAVVLGFLTFGAQATAAPDGVPVAVAAPPEIAQRIAAHGGGQLDWTIASPADARKLLEDKKVYGVLELGPGPSATVVTSGAVNPAGTQVAQQALTGAASALAGAPKQEVLHPVSLAGRTAPLAASALAWIGALVAGLALTQLAKRTGRTVGVGARFLQVVGAGVLVTAAVAGFFALWDVVAAARPPTSWGSSSSPRRPSRPCRRVCCACSGCARWPSSARSTWSRPRSPGRCRSC